MKIHLAPMEGVVDYLVRDQVTAIGGVDQCVTEFVRVVDQPLPRRVFRRLCPELENLCKTPAGVPVKLQLLGGQAPAMGENALRAVRAGANAIDLNFGCPAKTVNKSDGGACLLRTPTRLYDIVAAVRRAVPKQITVSAKIRLGYEDRSGYLECAHACADGGADELVVHGRSKADGYHPPAYWDHIGHIHQALSIPVIANGEIWTVDDFIKCREESHCEDIMLGRGLLARPDLALQIKALVAGQEYQPQPWRWALEQLHQYYQTSLPIYPIKYAGNRIKQWLMYLRTAYPEANKFFETIKKERNPDVLEHIFQQQLGQR
ncbi:tRNA-dihydrouridine synthase [Gilvimarinus sp. SDUM040013]|uniref:tRNA-dihydrouridine(16) synthase n=1 Tax=Gilvimarinus gilvus TaxID=3058038 RepID=A0ABU4S6U4_9GAMM|nr:tRNA-dihydrouridine synthase [Gilvimarinus sp. SDUM040013]MDO3384351.1 tRNA-dihydrouridine synthase [Gilvimarinus sp. SDUM040013]MDX6851199.1 tRNA-dihydrouridine synthase [Gilvimarinus sp. SDUM040013]